MILVFCWKRTWGFFVHRSPYGVTGEATTLVSVLWVECRELEWILGSSCKFFTCSLQGMPDPPHYFVLPVDCLAATLEEEFLKNVWLEMLLCFSLRWLVTSGVVLEGGSADEWQVCILNWTVGRFRSARSQVQDYCNLGSACGVELLCRIAVLKYICYNTRSYVDFRSCIRVHNPSKRKSLTWAAGTPMGKMQINHWTLRNWKKLSYIGVCNI
jgi:hypothetical protein